MKNTTITTLLLISLLSTKGDAETLKNKKEFNTNPFACSELIRVKYNKRKIVVPAILFRKNNMCSKRFRIKLKNNDKVG